MKSSLKCILITLLFFFSVFLSLSLQSTPRQEKTQELQHEVTVTLKLVQVSVTDKEGNAVLDLKEEDFQLFEDGKLKEIAAFETHFLDKPEKQIKKRIEEKAPETKPASSREIPSIMNRKFFLLIDYFKNDVIGIKRSKKAAIHFIDTQILPTDEVAVLSYTRQRGMTLHLYLTTDMQKARKAIMQIKGFPRIRWGIDGGDGEPEEPYELKKVRVLRFTSEIRELAKALWHIPGNKNFILFSAGIQRYLMYDQRSAPAAGLERLGMQAIGSGLFATVQDMSKELAAANCPVFSVNTEGARGQIFYNSPSLRGDHSLKMISDLSGGKYFPDVEDSDDIANEIQQLTGNYYVLGYYVDEKWDGKFHEIQVKVKRKGCRVYAQKGYFNPKSFSEFSEREKNLDILALATGGRSYFQDPLKFPSISLPFGNIEESNFVLISKISKEEMKEIISGKTEVMVLVLDEENDIILKERQETNFSENPEKTIYHYSILPLFPGNYKCRVILRNQKTGNAAVATSSITIPEEAGSGMKLYPPLLLIPEESACYSETPKKRETKLGKKSLSLKNIYPLIPSEYFPLVGQLDKRVSKLLAVMRFCIVDIQEPDIDLTTYLIQDSSAQKTSLAPSVLFRKKEGENIHIFLLEYNLPRLEPGEYIINFIAEELKTKSKSQVSSEIQVK